MPNLDFLTVIFGNFHFLRPWFIVLIPFIVLIVWKLQIMLAGTNPWQDHIAPHLRRFMIGDQSTIKPAKSRRHQQFLMALLGLMLIALLGPTFWKKSVTGVSVKPQVMILLDQSSSMLVNDVKPSRHKRATFLIKDIISQLPDAAIGLMAYAGTEHPLVPITFTHEILTQALDNVNPLLMPVQGSNASPALGAVAASLANQPEATVIWITDEIKARESAEIKQQLQLGKYRSIIIGVGTKQGGPIELPNGQLLRDQGGTLVIPSYNQTDLKRLARESGALFFDQKDLFGSNLQKVTSLIGQSAETKANSGEPNETQALYDKWEDLGPWFLLPAALLFASFFRKGFLFGFILLLQPVMVTDLQARNQNQTAWDSYQANDYTAALETTDSLLEGAAHFQLQDYAAASIAWNRATTEHEPASPGAVQAFYNLGNALAYMDNFEAAAGAYEQVLEWQPDHAKAKFNLDLVQQLLDSAEEEQEKKQQENKEGLENEQGQDGKESQDGQDSGQGQGQADQDATASQENQENSKSNEQQAGNDAQQNQSEQGDKPPPELDQATQDALEQAMSKLTQKDEAEKAKAAQSLLDAQKEDEENGTEDEQDQDLAESLQTEPEDKGPQSPTNPKIDAIQLQPSEVLQRKMLRQYQLQQRRRGPTDDEPW